MKPALTLDLGSTTGKGSAGKAAQVASVQARAEEVTGELRLTAQGD